MERCTHTDQTRDVQSSAQGREECLVCGHIGCRGSSKNKHGSKHVLGTSHPIVASFETDEDWRWCYVDETLV
jgi:hypothetical protein